MGASVGTDTGDSVNVELNVVPFIDLMSCLTAFLLVTAVWSSYAQIPVAPKGESIDGVLHEAPPTALSVLLTEHDIWVGLSTGSRHQIHSSGGGYDWDALATLLGDYSEMPDVQNRPNPRAIEIAGENTVVYQDLITAMDYSIGASFDDIGYVDPKSLTVRFKE